MLELLIGGVATQNKPAEPPTQLMGKLLASDGQLGAELGGSVSISGDGNTALVGAPVSGRSGATTGAAYVFQRSGTTWSQVAKLLASDGANGDRFGWSVSISGDGNTALVGAYYDDNKGNNSGSAYIFKTDGATWSQVANLTASDGEAGDYFGRAVALSGDGNTALVGAYAGDDSGNDSGAAYVFRATGTTWNQVAKLTASDGAAGDYFGYSVSLSGDGNTALVGAYLADDNETDTGSAYVFRSEDNTWSQVAKLLASDRAASDYFGLVVSLSGDGNTALVGAAGVDSLGTNSGAAYVFSS